MPRVIKEGDSSLGHCWPPTLPVPNTATSKKVFAHGFPIMVNGDQYMPHPGPCGNTPPHSVGTIIGSENVFIDGKGILRDGDPLNCGDVANTLAGTVFCNGGGQGPSERPDINQTYGFSVRLPKVEYPPIRFKFRYRTVFEQQIFTGCAGYRVSPSIYTVLVAEGSGSEYLNYPGLPLTVLSGGQGLPPYANNLVVNPIPILELNFMVSLNGGPYTNVIGNDLGDGIKINKDTGELFGTPTNYFDSKSLRVTVRNFVGSKPYDFPIVLEEVINCP